METMPEPTGTERGSRFRPGFPWGLAVGAIVVVLLVGATAIVVTLLYTARFGAALRAAQEAKAPVVRIVPVASGKPWFTVGADGKGTLQAWAGNETGSGGSGVGTPEGAIGFLTIGNVGLVDGVRVSHTAKLWVRKDTRLLLGGKPYTRPGEWFVGNDAKFRTRKLTVEFHRVGEELMAESINASAETSRSPFQF